MQTISTMQTMQPISSGQPMMMSGAPVTYVISNQPMQGTAPPAYMPSEGQGVQYVITSGSGASAPPMGMMGQQPVIYVQGPPPPS